MTIPFVKTQAVGNDFLIVEGAVLRKLGIPERLYPELARQVCHRHLGLGADGLELVFPRNPDSPPEVDAIIRIFNSDGSEAEISGNGTRCVAAWLIDAKGGRETLHIATKAGVKKLRLTGRDGDVFFLEISMGEPEYQEEDVGCSLETESGTHTVTIVNVGNPQCSLMVENFDLDWRAIGSEIEFHPRFLQRTNVSFVKVLNRNTIDVRFWERGAGETASSGTGAAVAAVAAILSGDVESPVKVVTTAGDMHLRWEDNGVILEGPAVIVAMGEYRWNQ